MKSPLTLAVHSCSMTQKCSPTELAARLGLSKQAVHDLLRDTVAGGADPRALD